ncbi:MAG: family 10 glycosylhydrolase [Faecalibacterium sp.]|nr:family 10 glycosylhydrolase [Faecalibacterium sp.]
MKQEKIISRRRVLQCGAALGAAALLPACAEKTAASGAASSSSTASSAQSNTSKEENAMSTPSAAKTQYCAMWISYLDWQNADFTSADHFRAYAGQMFQNCVDLGLNTVITQVRPFGDAMYQSSLFPWCHVCTGTQGQAPGFDPLNIMIEEAHSRGLSLEAWINPYRLRLNAEIPPALAENGLANTHPEWCVSVNDGLYLNPAIPEAAAYVVSGITELLENYAVDGIHFDDYFYPTTDASVDAAQYAAGGNGASLDDWRRANVTALVQSAYNAVKAKDPTLRFGISPQGNPENNYNGQYSDVSAWMAPGAATVDYICPQIYWGYHYTLKSGSDRFAFENIVPEWLAMPRDASVRMYVGLGAYRIGTGDGGANEDSTTQWQSGYNLSDMAREQAADGADGYILYRYDSLYHNADFAALAQAECTALATYNAERAAGHTAED